MVVGRLCAPAERLSKDTTLRHGMLIQRSGLKERKCSDRERLDYFTTIFLFARSLTSIYGS